MILYNKFRVYVEVPLYVANDIFCNMLMANRRFVAQRRNLNVQLNCDGTGIDFVSQIFNPERQ